MEEQKEEPEPKKAPNEPVLMDESYINKSSATPWIFIAFLVFAIVTSFWKKYITPKISEYNKPAIEQSIDQTSENN